MPNSMRFLSTILGDVMVFAYPDSAQEFCHHLRTILDEIAQHPDTPESPWNYLLLVLDVNSRYQGVLPVSGELGDGIRQEYEVHLFNENDLYRAITKVKLAYDLGQGTNPNL